MEVWENMKKILVILSLLILSDCSSREVYQSLDTRADFEKQINFMGDK